MKQFKFTWQPVVNIFTWLWKSLPMILLIVSWLAVIMSFFFLLQLIRQRTTDGLFCFLVLLSAIISILLLLLFYRVLQNKMVRYLLPWCFVLILIGLCFLQGVRLLEKGVTVLHNETTGQWINGGCMYNNLFERDVIKKHNLKKTINISTDFHYDKVSLKFIFGTYLFQEKMTDPNRDEILQKLVEDILFTVSVEAMPSAQKQEEVKNSIRNVINDGDEIWCEVTYWQRKMYGYAAH